MNGTHLKLNVIPPLILFFSIFYSNPENEIMETKKIVHQKEKSISLNNVDSVIIHIVPFTDMSEVYFVFKNSKLDIKVNKYDFDLSKYVSHYKQVSRNDDIKFISELVEGFYFKKSEKIILKKTKFPGMVTDYPFVDFDAFRKGKRVVSNFTRIGDESHKIVYNPRFIEFVEYLMNLAGERIIEFPVD